MTKNHQLLIDSFPELYPKLYRLVRVRIGHVQEAEEIVAKTVETMLKNLHRFNPKRKPLDAWATGIAKQHILHYWRDRRPIVELLETEQAASTYQSFHDQMAVDHLLNTLSDEQKALMILRYVDGYSAEELAPKFGLSPSAIRQKLHRLKNNLKIILSPNL